MDFKMNTQIISLLGFSMVFFSRLNGLAIILACTVEDFLENRAYQPWLLFDYYFREYRKSVESLWRKGSTLFGQFASKLCNTNETLANQVFSILRPDNSDSEGRWFESSQAYKKTTLNLLFELPQIVRTAQKSPLSRKYWVLSGVAQRKRRHSSF